MSKTNNEQKLANNSNVFSEIVKIALKYHDKTCSIKIPSREVFRLKKIFEDQSYSIPAPFIENICKKSEKNIIVDIGANVGAYSIYSKVTYPNSIVYSFEPMPYLFSLLKDNIKPFSDINIFPLGLSNKDEEADLWLNSNNSGQTSTKVRTDKKIQIQLHNAKKLFGKLNINKISILKIDTEGCEVEILSSIKEMLPRIKVVLIEYHSDIDRRKIDNLLKDYSIYNFSVETLECGEIKYINKNYLSI